jgi:hypothetical protein
VNLKVGYRGRYTYRQAPLTLTFVNEPIWSPGACHAKRAASLNSGVNPMHRPVDGDVIDLDTPLGQQLLDVALREPIMRVPPRP